MDDTELQQHVLTLLNDNEVIPDTAEIVARLGITNLKLDAAVKSLLVDEFVILDVIQRREIALTAEG